MGSGGFLIDFLLLKRKEKVKPISLLLNTIGQRDSMRTQFGDGLITTERKVGGIKKDLREGEEGRGKIVERKKEGVSKEKNYTMPEKYPHGTLFSTTRLGMRGEMMWGGRVV